MSRAKKPHQLPPAPPLPEDQRAVLAEVVGGANYAEAGRRAGLTERRLRTVAKSTAFMAAMAHAFEEADVTMAQIAVVFRQALDAEKAITVSGLRGVQHIEYVPDHGTRLYAARLLLDLNFKIAKKALEAEEREQPQGRRPLLVAPLETAGMSQADLIRLAIGAIEEVG